ncbi:MAG TPA: long-chain fatty acid--CoA ligase, partial [Desulfobacteraceae bacterium]|nr:long-chain fatty acid--CoA ligase [Desulfobacteraceae bacterium]
MDDRIWFKSYVKGVPTSIDFKEYTTPEFMEISAEKFGGRIALNFMGKKISYRELDQMCNRFANALIDMGVKKGDRIALMLPNLPQMVIGYYGAWRAGAVPVPNNPLYTDRELEYQFNDCGAEYLVTLDLLAPRMLALWPRTPIKAIISAHINDYLPFPLRQIYP